MNSHFTLEKNMHLHLMQSSVTLSGRQKFNKNRYPLSLKSLAKGLYIIFAVLLYTGNASAQTACAISEITAVAGPCDPATNTYTVTGSITFSNPPATGVLTVRIPNGRSVQFTAPFTSPQSYTLAGLNSDGASHTVQTLFSEYLPGASCLSSATYNAPVLCLAVPACDPGQSVAFEEFSAEKSQTQTNINNFPMTGIKYFDTQGGTRILTKVLLSFATTTKQSALIETKDAVPSEFEFESSTTSSIRINVGTTPLVTSATSYSSGLYPLPAGIRVAAQNSWPGDNASGFTINSMGPLVSNALLNMTDPRTTTDWVTNLTGDPTTDDDILYIAPIIQDRTGNLVYTAPADLATFTGTGDINFIYNATGQLNGSGPGNFSASIRTVASSNVSVRYYYCTTVLPVDLKNFTIYKLEENLNLAWATTNEKNFSHFETQRSKNAKDFETIGIVKGNNSGTYNYKDLSPINGVSYYRLKMVDLDGTFKYSRTISAHFENGGSYISVENPARNGEFNVMTNLKEPSFSLINSKAQKIDFSVNETAENKYALKAKSQTPGIYILKITSDGKTEAKKVLIP